MQIAPLGAAHALIGLNLLDQAFADDPSLSWYLLSQHSDYAQRRRDYLAAYLDYHQANALPILGAWQGDRLIGLCCFSPGEHIADSDSLRALGQQISQHCGVECLARLDQLLNAFDQQLSRPDLARIEFIAVAAEQQGQGIGSTLLTATLAWLRNNGCPGVTLETGEARNLPLYRRHGFTPTGDLQLPGLTQHYLQHIWA